MLDRCYKVASEIDILFNASKSKCMVVGPSVTGLLDAIMTLGNIPMQWVSKIKYLGIHFTAAKHFKVDFSDIRRKYFSSLNVILSKCRYVSDPVKLQLIESQCLSILLYAIESLNLKRDELSSLNSCWNTAYRKIFNFNKWESVKELIHLLGRMDLKLMENYRRITFVKSMCSIRCSNNVVNLIANNYVNSVEYYTLINKYGLQATESHDKIKAVSYSVFNKSVVAEQSNTQQL